MAYPLVTVNFEGLRGRHRNALEVAGEGGQKGAKGLFHAYTQGVLVNYFDVVDVLIIWPYPGIDLGIENTIEVPFGRLRVEIGAIVERHPLLQVKDICAAVVQDLP